MRAGSARRGMVIAGLVGVWLLGWGEVSVANVLTGIVVASLALAVFPLRERTDAGRPVLRPLPIAKLVAFFVFELAQSNVSMARDVLGSRGRMRTGVIRYPLRVRSEPLLTSLANVIALTPGAMPIEVDDDPCALYVHVTRMDQRATTERNLARYEELFVRAFGSPEQVAELEAATKETGP